MKGEDNYFDYIKTSKSIFNDDFIKYLSSSNIIDNNNIQQASYYLMKNVQ